MTSPTPISGELRRQAVQTNGIGQHCDAHLNLTRSLADVWGVSQAEVAATRPMPKPEPLPATMGRPPGPVEPKKIPYAGKGE